MEASALRRWWVSGIAFRKLVERLSEQGIQLAFSFRGQLKSRHQSHANLLFGGPQDQSRKEVC